MKALISKIMILAIVVVMATPVLAIKSHTSSIGAAVPHNFWFLDLNGGNFRIRDTSSDGTNPNGGVARLWVRDTPTEVNTNVGTSSGLPHPGASDWIGANGQSYADYCSLLQTGNLYTTPTNGEEVVFIMELDANRVAEPRVYTNNGVQIGTTPHGYIWAGNDSYNALISDQEVLPSGDPPTKFFEVLEMAAPETFDYFSWSWSGLELAQPSDVAGDVLGQIESWALLESVNPDGPWTQVGKAAFGSQITYMASTWYYCAVPYWKGDVRALVYSEPTMWSGHYPSRATGPIGASNSTSLTITFEANCGCFGDHYLYYSNDRNVTWYFIGIFAWTDWGTMYYPWNAPGNGEYWWYTADEGLADHPSSGTPAEAGPYTITQLFQVDDLMAYGHTPTAADIRLTWSEQAGATSYNIYRSLSVVGTGFDFGTVYATVPMTGTGTVIWDDVGAYADANNYAWVIRAVYGATEATVDLDNIAFKLVKTLFQGTGLLGAADNYIALPYRFAFTTALATLSDMRQYGNPVNAISSINNWNQDTSIWEARGMFAGPDFTITPGKGYRAVAILPSVTWKIVGAYDSSINHNLFIGTGTLGASDNSIALPYHSSLLTAATIIADMRMNGTPTLSVTSLNRWNQDTSAWEARGAFAGINFAITPGEAYRAVVNQNLVTWQCPVRVPGP